MAPAHPVTHPFVTPGNPRQDAPNSVTPTLPSQDVTDVWRSVTFPRDPRSGHGERHTPSRPLNQTARKAREGTCPSCGSTVLAGLDADVMGTGAVIDPDPITPARELTEWAAGRRTYTYTPTRREIDYRDAGSLTPRPNVHPTHTCPKEDPLW